MKNRIQASDTLKAVIITCICLAVLAVAASLSYFLLVIQPREEQAKINYQKQEDQAKSNYQKQKDTNDAYQACLKNPPQSNTGNPYLDNYVRTCGALKPR